MREHSLLLYVKPIPVGPMMNIAYLVGASEGAGAVLIDPSWDAKTLIAAARSEKRTIEALLATHTHFDHVNALDEIARELKVPVYVHEKETGELPTGLTILPTADKSHITASGLDIVCLHTPGHTTGSQCFFVNGALFTGDTLFVGACGRVDLEGGSPTQMAASLARLATLPEATVVFPGHDYGGTPTSTIGDEKNHNPYMLRQ